MSSWITGTRTCQAAIFMYKGDNTVARVKDEIERINHSQGAVCGEHYVEKQGFIAALSDWNASVDPGNSFLCIYAHAGKDGICPLGEYVDEAEYRKDLIAWDELASTLKRPVQYLWLLGCTTKRCMEVWSSVNGPVSGLLLVTSLDIHWGDFVGCFEHEISLDPIRSVDKMVEAMRSAYPSFAHNTHYFKPEKDGWLQVELGQGA